MGCRSEMMKRFTDISIGECKLRIYYRLEFTGLEDFIKIG